MGIITAACPSDGFFNVAPFVLQGLENPVRRFTSADGIFDFEDYP
jgi:hypothetical protein